MKFLLKDPDFPRSIHFCLFHMGSQLQRLPASPETWHQLQRLKSIVDDANLGHMDQDALHDFIDEIQQGLCRLHDRLAEAYFGG